MRDIPVSKGFKTKEMILDVALKVASREGLDGLTIGSLAKAAGMSKSGLFAHFNSKDNLQLVVLERAAELYTQQVLRPALEKPRGEPRLRAIFENWIQFLNGDRLPGGSIFIAAGFELDDKPGPLRDYVQKAQRDLLKNLEKAAQLAVEEGHFSSEMDTKAFAWVLYAFVLGFHHSKRMLEDPEAEAHLRRAFEGLIESAKRNLNNDKNKKRLRA